MVCLESPRRDVRQPEITGLDMAKVHTESSILVLSPDFLPELKKLPDNVVSMEAAVDEVRCLRSVLLGDDTDW